MKWYRLYKESFDGLTKDEFDELFYDYVDVADEYYCKDGYKSKNANMLKSKMEEFIDTVKSNVSRDYKRAEPDWEKYVNMVINGLDDNICDGNDDWIESKKRQLWYDFISYKPLVGTNTNESSDAPVDIKKLLKMNGVTKLPSGTKFSGTKASWEKHKGHAGSNTIRKMCIQLDHAGWKRGDWTTGGIPDGSSVANSRTYTSPDGKILMSYTEYYGCTSYDNSFYITFKLVESGVNESTIKGTGRVDFDDDLVAVYDPSGKLEYKGLFDDCPYKDDDMRYDKTTMTYRIEGPNGDYRTMAKLAESNMNESSRFGFKVGDRVVLTKDKSNRFSGDFIPAGTEGEIVAVDKPMPGVMKVKIEDWKTISVPERGLKLAGTDNEPWKSLAAKRPAEPKRDVKPERPEDYYMRPTTYGSPRYTGD